VRGVQTVPSRPPMWMAVQQHYRLAAAAVRNAQRHVADVDIFEREAFEHALLDPHDVRVRDEAGRFLLDAGSIPARGPDVDDRLAWP